MTDETDEKVRIAKFRQSLIERLKVYDIGPDDTPKHLFAERRKAVPLGKSISIEKYPIRTVVAHDILPRCEEPGFN